MSIKQNSLQGKRTRGASLSERSGPGAPDYESQTTRPELRVPDYASRKFQEQPSLGCRQYGVNYMIPGLCALVEYQIGV